MKWLWRYSAENNPLWKRKILKLSIGKRTTATPYGCSIRSHQKLWSIFQSRVGFEMGGWKYPFGMTNGWSRTHKACTSRDLNLMSTTSTCVWSMDRKMMESQSTKITTKKWTGLLFLQHCSPVQWLNRRRRQYGLAVWQYRKIHC